MSSYNKKGHTFERRIFGKREEAACAFRSALLCLAPVEYVSQSATGEGTTPTQDEAKYVKAPCRAAAKFGTRPIAMQNAVGAVIAFVRGKKASAADNRAGECVTEGRVGQASKTRPVGEAVIVVCPLLFCFLTLHGGSINNLLRKKPYKRNELLNDGLGLRHRNMALFALITIA